MTEWGRFGENEPVVPAPGDDLRRLQLPATDWVERFVKDSWPPVTETKPAPPVTYADIVEVMRKAGPPPDWRTEPIKLGRWRS